MNEDSNAEHHQRLKAAVHYSVGKLCEELGSKIGGVTFSKETIATISELTDHQISVYARDLEKFSKHGKRSTINVEDVKLLARRNPSLAKHLSDLMPSSATADEKKKTKKKKDTTPVAQDVAGPSGADDDVNIVLDED